MPRLMCLLGFLLGLGLPLAVSANDAQLNQLLDRYWEDFLKIDPIQATYVGDSRYHHLLPNPLDPEHRQRQRVFYRESLEALRPLEGSDLSREGQLSLELLKWECDTKLKQLDFDTHLLPLNQFNSFHLTIGQFASGQGAQPFKTVNDYERWLQRLDRFLPWCFGAQQAMREGIRKGITLPKSLTRKVIPQIEGLSKGPIHEHLFYQPVHRLPDSVSPDEKRRLTHVYSEIVERRVIPAFQSLLQFLRDEYLPACRDNSGILALPQGREFYRHQIKIYTTTELNPDEIFELGHREIRRLTDEMEKVQTQLNFPGNLRAFFAHVRTSPQLTPFSDPRQVIGHFNRIHQRMRPQVERLFRLRPKTAFEVRRTEAFREASSSAEYQPGSLDGTRPGIFYVPIPSVRDYNIVSDEDLFLHEAIPGHHYQISLQQENTKLPAFRRPLWYSAYGEGWALYCESLGKELGLYQDPYQYFGMLSAEMHRAIRLVVDVGLHQKGWTREQAIQFSLDHEAEPESSIVSEIERYMAWPGQALSYKIGQLKILELRKLAETRLGSRFEIKDFHDKILESGCLPLTILEKKIRTWIDGLNQ